jgi:lambda family phage portal protein
MQETSGTAHYGADLLAPELRGWYPQELSADAELLPELPILRARTADLIRNHGLASGAVQTHLDNIIGPNLRLSLKPNHRRLGISVEAAAEWARIAEAAFLEHAEDPECFIDASRRHTFNGLLQLAYRSYLTSFESLATVEWLPDRPGSHYATAIQQLDPALLSNPDGEQNGPYLRDGVVLGLMGDPVAYWLASSLNNDSLQFGSAIRTWKRIEPTTPWGRRQIVHVFDGEKPGQSRGKTGIVSVIAKTKMLEKLEQSTLQASILNAMYAAVVESPVAWELIGASLGAKNDRAKRVDGMQTYMQDRNTWHKEGSIRYNGIKIPHLYPGEKLEMLTPKHPSAAFASFEEAVLRHLAGGFNMTYEQFSRDYSKTNYSSARAAMIEAWRFFSGRRHFIAAKVATQYMAVWLEEAMDRGDVPTPAGAPDFLEAKAAYIRAQWIGPGRGHIDPLKEENAITISLSNYTTTLEKECAEKGLDWEEVLEQRAREAKRRKELEQEFSVSLAPDGDEVAKVDPTVDSADDIEQALAEGDIDRDEAEDRIDEAVTNGDFDEIEAADLRERLNAYGMAVRAGAITPQPADERTFREQMQLPLMSSEVEQSWSDVDGGVRRPVTLAQPAASTAPAVSSSASERSEDDDEAKADE